MADHDNDIDALLYHLDSGYWPEKHAALAALVAERDKLAYDLKFREGECDNLREIGCNAAQRIRDLERQLKANQPADRDRELRERLICAALTGIIGDISSYEDAADAAVRHADATLAAMRKGVQDGK
jgi:hypothetical protein